MRSPGRVPLRAVLLWLGGIDLRLTLLAVAPVLPLIHHDLGLTESGIAAVSNLPVLVLATSSLFGSLVVARLGARRVLIAGLWFIAITGALRGVGPSQAMLFSMTFLMGIGIALVQPAFPSLARTWFPDRHALGASIWTNGLLFGEALAASLTLPLLVPLARGWEGALAAWSVVVGLTALAFGLAGDGDAARSAPVRSWVPNFRERTVWQIGALQSVASIAYFGANTFIPDFLVGGGARGLILPTLAALNVAQLPSTFAVGFIPIRILARPLGFWLLAAAIALAALGLVALPPAGKIVCAGLIGITTSYVLTFSFALPAMLAHHDDVPRIAAGAYTLGYTFSFLATLLSGAAWDLTHVAAVAFVPLFAAAALLAAVGPPLGRRVLSHLGHQGAER